MKHRPCNYDQKPIVGFHGTFSSAAVLGTYEMLIKLYIAVSPCQPIIGRDLICGLNLIINAPSGPCIYLMNSAESPSVQVVASDKQPNYSNLLNCFPALLLP